MDIFNQDKNIFLKNKYVKIPELDFLKNKLHKLSDENGNFILINGNIGEGKSKILKLFIESVKDVNTLVLSSKCFKSQRKIPYIAFKEILYKYIEIYKLHSYSKKNIVKNIINKNLGELGKVLLDIYPPLKEIIDSEDKLVSLDSGKEKVRMGMVINNLLNGIFNCYDNTVIVIDDLQWIDETSFEILTKLIKEIKNYKVLLVCTSCCDGEFKGSILNDLHTVVESDKYNIYKLSLRGFGINKLKEFLNLEKLFSEQLSNEIYDFINSKARGNQYFSSELVRYFFNEKIIKYRNKNYIFDWNKLRVANISNSADDLFIERISNLPDIKKTIIEYAIVFGCKFDIEILFQLMDIDEDKIIELISELIDDELLIRDMFLNYKVFFSNTRVRDILYKNIDKERKIYFNLKIANVLEKLYVDKDDRYFILSYHYLEGENYEKSIKLLLESGLVSKKIFAFESAKYYFEKVKYIIENKKLENKKIYIKTLKSLGEIYIDLNNIRKAVNLFENTLLNLLDDNYEKADIQSIISKSYINISDYKNCEISVKEGLKLIGQRIPSNKFLVYLSLIKEITFFAVSGILRDEYLFILRKKGDNKKIDKYKLIVNFFLNLSWVYAMDDTVKFVLFTIKSLNFSNFKLYKTIEYSRALLSLAIVFMNIPNFKISKKYYDKSLEIKKIIDDKSGLTELYYFMGHHYNWNGIFEKGIEYGKKSVENLKKIGDYSEFGMALLPISQGYYFWGEYREFKIVIDQLYKYSINIKNLYILTASETYYLQYYRDKGDFQLAENHGLKSIDISYKESDWFSYVYSNIEIGNLFIETEQYSRALAHFKIAKTIMGKHNFLKNYIVSLYPNYAEAYILNFLEGYENTFAKAKKKHLKKIYKLCRKALKNTEKWIVFHGNSLRIIAKYYILKENLSKAEYFLLESIKINKKIDKKLDLAKSFYDYGVFLKLELRKKESEIYLRKAYKLFKYTESKHYINKIKKELDFNFSDEEEKLANFKDIKKSKNIDSIISLSNNISSILDIDILLKRVLEILMDITEAENGYILLKDDFTGKIEIVAEKVFGDKAFLNEKIVKEVANKGKVILTDNNTFNNKYLTYQVASIKDARKILCLPIKYNDEVKGVCFLDSKFSSTVFLFDDIEVVNTILTQTAISIDNAKLFKMAITDGLTGLLSSRHFKYLLKIEIQRSKRFKRDFGLVMVDLDYFKKINDTYGHLAGDFILSTVSDIMKDSFRDSDILARYGGEEFALLLTESKKDGIIKSLERFKMKIQNKEFIYDDKYMKITVSIGVAFYPKDTLDDKELLKFADMALYNSKRNGRNRISIYKDDKKEILI
jgi:diguanylate cyclase (GGDEF)-like protein